MCEFSLSRLALRPRPRDAALGGVAPVGHGPVRGAQDHALGAARVDVADVDRMRVLGQLRETVPREEVAGGIQHWELLENRLGRRGGAEMNLSILSNEVGFVNIKLKQPRLVRLFC